MDVPTQRRRSPRVRRTEQVHTMVDRATKRRLRVLLDRTGRSEASVARECLLALLDREGITDPEPAADQGGRPAAVG